MISPTEDPIMTETINSHVQQAIGAWKKLIDKQQEMAGSVTDELMSWNKKGVEKLSERLEQAKQLSSEVMEHAREISDPTEMVSTWSGMVDRHLEAVSGSTKSMMDLQAEGWDKARATLDTFHKASTTTFDVGMKVHKAWCDAVMETAKRSADWTPVGS